MTSLLVAAPGAVVGGAATGFGRSAGTTGRWHLWRPLLSRHCRRVVLVAAIVDGVVDWLRRRNARRRRRRADRAAALSGAQAARRPGLRDRAVDRRGARTQRRPAQAADPDLDRRLDQPSAQRRADRRCGQCRIGCCRTTFGRSQLCRDRRRGGPGTHRSGVAGADRQRAAAADRRRQPAGARYLTTLTDSPVAHGADRARGDGRRFGRGQRRLLLPRAARGLRRLGHTGLGVGRRARPLSARSRPTWISTDPGPRRPAARSRFGGPTK